MPSILIVNDDGQQSPYLPLMVKALAEIATVCVAVPAEEQSWMGKAMTRFSSLRVLPLDNLGVEAYSISGTPADCVNIAVSHLFGGAPDWVLSGINIGANVGLPFVIGSGTICAAFEGALQGLPAVAFSTRIPAPLFRRWSEQGRLDGKEGQCLLETTAERMGRMMQDLLSAGLPERAQVLNINFPGALVGQHPVQWVPVQNSRYRSLFARQGDTYQMQSSGKPIRLDEVRGDRDVIESGGIAVTPLSLTGLSMDFPANKPF